MYVCMYVSEWFPLNLYTHTYIINISHTHITHTHAHIHYTLYMCVQITHTHHTHTHTHTDRERDVFNTGLTRHNGILGGQSNKVSGAKSVQEDVQKHVN